MSFVVTGLTDYTEKATELLRAGVLFNDDFAQYEIQTGIKFKEYLNYVDAQPTFANAACGTPADGATTLTEKEIEVKDYRATDKLCYADLDSKALGGIDVASAVTADEIAKIKTKVNHDLWIGDTSGTDYIDGWLTLTADSTDKIVATSIGITSTSIDDAVIDMIAKSTPGMSSRGVLTIYMSLANFNLYKQNRLSANFYRDANADFGPLSMWAFGYEGQVKIEAKVGLGSTQDMILTWAKNLVIGTDEVSKVSSAEWINDPLTKNVHFDAAFKLGAQIKYTNEVVYFEAA